MLSTTYLLFCQIPGLHQHQCAVQVLKWPACSSGQSLTVNIWCIMKWITPNLGASSFQKQFPLFIIYSFSCTIFINVINLFVNHYILFLFAFYTASDRKENVILLHKTFQRLQPVWINIHSLIPHWASQASSWAGWFFHFHFGFHGPDASLDSFTSHCQKLFLFILSVAFFHSWSSAWASYMLCSLVSFSVISTL